MNSKFSILVVDDQPSMTATLADILEDEGYEVVIANSGEEAIERCHERSFDVALMDIRMPGLSGFETFRLIQTFSAATGVILMSAYSIVDMKREALHEGAVAVLQKPLDMEYVLDLIRKCKRPPILLVIRDPDDRRKIGLQLKSHKFRICTAGNFEEASQLAGQIRFKIIIFDYLTTGEKTELCETIEEISPFLVRIKLVDEETQAVSFDEAENEYQICKKPLEIKRLLETLSRIENQQRSELLTSRDQESVR